MTTLEYILKIEPTGCPNLLGVKEERKWEVEMT